MTGLLALAALAALQGAAAESFLDAQDPDRPRVSLDDFKALRDNNIFSPMKPRRPEPSRSREERREERRSESPPAKPKPPVLTGIVFDLKEGAHVAVVEDRNADSKLKLFSEPRFLKAGDEVAGCKVEAVAADRVTVRHGEAARDLKVGDELPAAASAAPAPAGTAPAAEPKAESSPADDAARNEILEALKKKNKKKRGSDEEP